VTITQDPDTGELIADPVIDGGAIVFRNEENLVRNFDIIKLQIQGTKNLANKDLEPGLFTFVIKDENGEIISIGTNGENGVIDFGEILYTIRDSGMPPPLLDEPTPNLSLTFIYEVSEIKGNAPKTTYDETIYFIEVTISRNNWGNLDVEWKIIGGEEDDEIVFENIYTLDPVYVTLSGNKNLTNKKPEADEFKFIVTDENETVVAEGTNDADGNIIFDTITYEVDDLDGELEKTFVYKVSEVAGIDSHVDYDETIYTVTVTVTLDMQDGSLSVTTDIRNGPIEFNNIYTPDPVSLTLNGNKTLANKNLEAGEFKFIVTQVNGTIVAWGTNDADGNIIFDTMIYEIDDLNDSLEKIFVYKASEVGGTDSRVKYDKTIYTVTVTLTLDMQDGSLSVTTDIIDSPIEFNNVYTPDLVSVTLSGDTTLTGRELEADEFKFIVMQENGTAIAEGTNDADGNIIFGTITYTIDDLDGALEKTFVYKVSEITGTENYMQYDETIYTVTVTLTLDTQTGSLIVKTDITDGSLEFHNIYTPPSTPTTPPSGDIPPPFEGGGGGSGGSGGGTPPPSGGGSTGGGGSGGGGDPTTDDINKKTPEDNTTTEKETPTDEKKTDDPDKTKEFPEDEIPKTTNETATGENVDGEEGEESATNGEESTTGSNEDINDEESTSKNKESSTDENGNEIENDRETTSNESSSSTEKDNSANLATNPDVPPALINTEKIPENIVTPPDGIEFYDSIPDVGAIALVDGWFAVELGDGWYEIFDQSGNPVGYVQLQEGENIEDWRSYSTYSPFNDSISYNWVVAGDSGSALAEGSLRDKGSAQDIGMEKRNPKTGDMILFAILGLLTISAVFAGIMFDKKKMKKSVK
jgi:pilin isopeptide linkage protein